MLDSSKGGNDVVDDTGKVADDEGHNSVLSQRGDGKGQIHNWRGVITLVGCALLMLMLGNIGIWGNISIYVLSYFHEMHGKIGTDFIFLVDTLQVLSNWFGHALGAYLMKVRRWHPQLVCFTSSALSLGGMFLSSYTTNLTPFLVTFCMIGAFGNGVAYIVPLIVGWEFYPQKKGVATGVVLGSYGFGSFIFAQLSTRLVNPDGINPTVKDPNYPDLNFYDSSVADRVPYMIRVLCYVWAALGFVGTILIQRPPKSETNSIAKSNSDNVIIDDTNSSCDEFEDGQQSPDASVGKVNQTASILTSSDLMNTTDDASPMLQSPQIASNEPTKPMIKGVKFAFYTKSFWQYFLLMIISTIFPYFFSYSMKTYGESDSPHEQISDYALTWVSSIGSGVLNGGSRVIFGILIDKYSFKFLFGTIMLIELANSLVCYWAAYWPPAYFACILINYVVIGGIFTLLPVSVQSCFGLEFGPQIYVNIMFGSFFGSLVNLFTNEWLFPATNYLTMFYFGSAVQVATLVVLYYTKEELDVKSLARVNGVKQTPC